MNELHALLADTAQKVLSTLPTDPDAAWTIVRKAALLDVMLPEAQGGFGGDWEDAFVVLRALGYHAAPDGYGVGVSAPKQRSANDEFWAGALVNACRMAGAMQAALDLSVQYVRERQQFGKPLASFQAIQQQLAVFAEETAAANMAALAACRAQQGGLSLFQIGAAKLRANMAAGVATNVAHQVHGAMGFTAQYKLQRLTKLLWQWRSEYGNDRCWSEWLGAVVAAKGPEGFWPALVAPATIKTLGLGD